MENEFGSISVDDNEKQGHEQVNGWNVNVYNLRDRSYIRNHYAMKIQPFS